MLLCIFHVENPAKNAKGINLYILKMKQKVTLLTLLIITPLLMAQRKDHQQLCVVFYNVENLFDTRDDPDVNDDEFTPLGSKNWDKKRFNKKIESISRVLKSTSSEELPDIIGLAEVENKDVLKALAETSALRKANYEIFHQDSPDQRGIDVALLVKAGQLKNVRSKTIEIEFPFNEDMTTRDILHVEGMASDGKKIHFFVNHWSSRREGRHESERKRIACALHLKKQTDGLLSRENDPRIIIMGDFNDEPTNKSILNILNAGNKRKNIGPGDLFNLFYDIHNTKNKGSSVHRNKWLMTDQIMVSYNLINNPTGYSCDYSDGRILIKDDMVYHNQKNMDIPNRSYGGDKYYGGISDHFPVYVIFQKKVQE